MRYTRLLLLAMAVIAIALMLADGPIGPY